MMDCEQETTNENADPQHLMERNKQLEENTRKMKSDYLILKEKIICIDSLIQKLKDKHTYCEMLEKKYSELKSIADDPKRLCGNNVSEYQDLLMTFGPLKMEKEKLEAKCSKQIEEMDKLKNIIRCHEVVQNQMTEVNKKQKLDLDDMRKENMLIHGKMKKLKQMFKSSEKKLLADKEKIERKEITLRRSSKRLAANRGEGEGGQSAGEGTRSVEASSVGGASKEETTNDESKRRKTGGVEKQQPKMDQQPTANNPRRGRPRKCWPARVLAGEVEDCKHSGRSVRSNRSKSVHDLCADNDDRRLVQLYQDLLMSSDDDDKTQHGGDGDNEATVKKISHDVVNEEAVDGVDCGDWISCIRESHKIINASSQNEMGNSGGDVGYNVGGVSYDVGGVSYDINQNVDYHSDDTIITPFPPQKIDNVVCPFYFHSRENVAQPIKEPIYRLQLNDDGNCDFTGVSDNGIASEVANDDAQNIIKLREGSNIGEMDATSTRNREVKTSKKSLAETIDILKGKERNLSKEKGKRRVRSNDNGSSVPATMSLEKFYELNVEEALSSVSIAKPPSPLPSHPRAGGEQLAPNVPPQPIVVMTTQSKDIAAKPRSLVPRHRVSTYGNNYDWDETNYDHPENGHNFANFECESQPILMGMYLKLVKLVRVPRLPISPFLFEARNSGVGGMSFVRMIMKAIRKFSFDATRYLFRRGYSNDDPRVEPTLPPSIARIVEIIIACGSTLPQGEDLLEMFVKESFPLIIYHKCKSRVSKFNEFFMSTLCCCIIGILRKQGNMERVRMLLYQVLRYSNTNSRICTTLMSICAVWPQCLMPRKDCDPCHFSAIQKVFQYYITIALDQQESTKDFVTKLCGWENVEQNPEELTSVLFKQANLMFEKCKTKEDASKISWEMHTALTFMCTKEGWEWTSTFMISGYLWPFLGAWANHPEGHSGYFVQVVIDLLGDSLQTYLDKIDTDNYNNILVNLQSLVMQSSVDLKIRESAVIVVLKLLNCSIPYDIIAFLNEHSHSFDEDTLQLLRQMNLLT